MQDHILAALKESAQALQRVIESPQILKSIEKSAQIIIQALRQQGRIFSAGNGGSMCDAMHFAEELSGRYRKDRPALAALSISDPSHISCTANDFGYDFVFSRFLEAHGRPGDVLVGFSTSGKSPSILKAAEIAKKLKMKVIGLTGRQDSPLSHLVDSEICTGGGNFADRAQELHIKAVHIMIECVEREFFPNNYA